MALKGCCCCRLREGVLAIGITFLVLTVLGALLSIPNYLRLGQAEAELAEVRASGQLPDDQEAEILRRTEGAFTMARVSVAVQSVEMLLSVLFNSLLVHGVRRSVPGMLLAWLVYYAIVFTLTCMCGAALLTFGIILSAATEPIEVAGAQLGTAVGAAFAVGGVVVLGVAAFFWYLWAVVHAYHREVREQQGSYKREMLMEESPPAYQPHPQVN